MTTKLKDYLLWLTVFVLISSCVFVVIVGLNPPEIEKGWTTTNHCIFNSVDRPLTSATQTAITATPICATQAAQFTAEASIPDWWPWGH